MVDNPIFQIFRIGTLALCLSMASCENENPVSIGEEDPILVDVDGNKYRTIRIGNQVWTAENIRTTRLNDGTAIDYAPSDTAWSMRTTPAYCFFNNTENVDSIEKFGALYNWYAANSNQLAPVGWRVPTDSDWTVLEKYLISSGYNWDGNTSGNKIAKSMAAQSDWDVSGALAAEGAVGNGLSKNNKSGFSALPGGFRSDGGITLKGIPDAAFYSIGFAAFWWGSSSAGSGSGAGRSLHKFYENLEASEYGASNGFSIRLIKD